LSSSEYDATAVNSVEFVPSRGVDHVDRERNAQGACHLRADVERSFAGRVSERHEAVAEEVQGAAHMVEPEVRGSMTWPSHRHVLGDRSGTLGAAV
jgi:hypothetical protein